MVQRTVVDILAAKRAAIAMPCLGCRNVIRAEVEPVIFDTGQLVKNLARSASDVENAGALTGTDVLAREFLPRAERACEDLEAVVDKRGGQDRTHPGGNLGYTSVGVCSSVCHSKSAIRLFRLG